MNDPAIAELTRQLAGLSAALARAEERASRTADEVQKASAAKKAAAAEGAKLSGVLLKLARDLTGVADKTEHHGRAFNTATATMRSFASEGVEVATEALVDFARQIPEGAANADRHQRALEQLGGAYGAVSAATNGAVSAEQAWQVQQRAAQSGVRLTAQELAAVTKRAREYAVATGTDLNQALEQLTDQIVDPGEELRKFGVFLRQGISAGDALRETLRQLGTQARETATSQLTAAEAQEQYRRAAQEASDALSAAIAQKLELRDFYTSLASWITDTANSADMLTRAFDAAVNTMREAVGLRSQIDQSQNQSNAGAFTGEAGRLVQQLRERGVDMRAFDVGQFAVNASPAQRARALQLLRERAMRPERGAAPDAIFEGPNTLFSDRVVLNRELPPEAEMESLLALSGEVTAATAGAREAAARSRRAADAARAREIQRRNQASTTAPSQSELDQRRAADLDRQFALAGQPGGSPEWARAFQQRLAAMEAAREAERGGPIATRLEGVNLQRQLAESDVALGRARFGGGAGAERVQILRDQREALSALVTEAEREEQTARLSGASAAELNEHLRQRLGLQQALAQTTRELTEATEENSAVLGAYGDSMLKAGEGVAQGFAASITAAIDGTQSLGAALANTLRESAKAAMQLSIFEGLKATAMGFTNLAAGNVPGSIAAFKGAAVWAATGIAAGVAVGVSRPSTPAVPGPSSVGSAGGSAQLAPQARVDRTTGGPLVLNVNVSGAVFETRHEVLQGIARGMSDAASLGYIQPGALRAAGATYE